MYIYSLHFYRIGKTFKMINPEHEIGECGSHGDFEICQFGMSTPASMLQCSVRFTKFGEKNSFNWKKYKFFSTPSNEMNTSGSVRNVIS